MDPQDDQSGGCAFRVFENFGGGVTDQPGESIIFEIPEQRAMAFLETVESGCDLFFEFLFLGKVDPRHRFQNGKNIQPRAAACGHVQGHGERTAAGLGKLQGQQNFFNAFFLLAAFHNRAANDHMLGWLSSATMA
ncbi:MAG: hypothetical protein PVI39_11245 [Desulfobacteraceae bacterium]